MPIQVDLRSPVVVVVGRWNEAILNQPAWVARHVLGKAEGEQVEVRTFLRQQEGSPPLQVWAFADFALGCLGHRLEIFQVSENDDQPVYNVLRKLSELLPHTPVSAVGVNFRVVADANVPSLSEKSETGERFDAIGITRFVERNDTLEIARDMQLKANDAALRQCKLKISRATNFLGGVIDFNFHYDLKGIGEMPALADLNPLDHWRHLRNRILKDVYDIEDLKETPF